VNILVVTHDLIVEKWHLMPWRTVIEVVRGMQADGHHAVLLSLTVKACESSSFEHACFPPGTRCISKHQSRLQPQLLEQIQQLNVDVIYWPLTWREPAWRVRVLGEISAAFPTLGVVGWFPGGAYSRHDAIYAWRQLGLRKSLPYLMEAFYPKRLQMRRLQKSGVDELLMMTPATARVATENGWPGQAVSVVPPAKDPVEGDLSPPDSHFTNWLGDSPFLLFMGPPAIIRGVYELLDAFELAAREDDSIRLVCLFRQDATLDREAISRKIDRMQAADRIFQCWESLPKDQLNGFIHACRAAVMPFVLVPSEIPLAMIETAAYGKPVISTRCGGSGEFVAGFGKVSVVGDVTALAKSMLTLCQDDDIYTQCCESAEKCWHAHPDWQQVARQWLAVAEKVSASRKKSETNEKI